MVKALNSGARSHGAAEFSRGADTAAKGRGDHFVQFYESEGYLLDSLSDFVGEGLGAGEACVVVAGPERRAGLELRLRGRGLDVSADAARGRYVALDSAETLSKFMVGCSPEPARFAGLLGPLIERAGSGSRGVRVFGDMVAHLCAEGGYAAAVRLEELWNELCDAHAFSLLCAYPIKGFGGESLAVPLAEVCSRHARVVPSESYAALACSDEQAREVVRLQQKAESLQEQLEERERLLASERRLRAEAEEASRLKDEFLATVSHELRTPLTAIVGWSHMLLRGGLEGEAAARAAETIERNAHAQAQLVEDLLDVSRIIEGKLSLSVAPVDLAAVINAAVDSVRLAAEAKGLALSVTLDPRARLVAGDEARLRQVVWNLLSNSIKFTPDGGRVEVSLRRAGRRAEIRVADTGCGISPDFLPYVFDRFRQGDQSTTRRHGGLGLGLAIVRHLVELHGGTVTADSDGPGRGCTFTILLPSQ
ncbi:MAG TPA: ATP-binding protein [Pyrinomonadaceae bacterium]|nr:ATP-binding protein [Pyrinomonadaceae bacterium]